MKRLLAIGFIWFCCAIAWMVLGSTIVYRSGEKSGALFSEVQLLWGPEMVQAPPSAHYAKAPAESAAPAAAEVDPAGAEGSQVAGSPTTGDVRSAAPVAPDPARSMTAPVQPGSPDPNRVAMPLDGSDIDVALELAHRKKGLLWFATYAVDFSARYAFANPTTEERELTMSFPLVAGGVSYDAFKVLDGDDQLVDAKIADGAASWTDTFAPGERRHYQVLYRSRGTTRWTYGAPTGTSEIKDFKLRAKVNVADIDFPAGTVSPSSHQLADGGWRGEWAFDSLVSSAPIAIELPKKLNPGPVASRITFFAPVSLLFFFFVVAVLAASRGRSIHPMNYFLLATAFFAFHLLFAYLVDHVAVMPSFAVSAAVSVILVTSYARLFVGWRFALVEVGLSQLLYLVL
ncbi:MAG: hypothetical protein JRI68_03210, partial [Deltaproteobacteria bacterium]|nr:hypothetical protein [Deltaproteobacteria bacterium]